MNITTRWSLALALLSVAGTLAHAQVFTNFPFQCTPPRTDACNMNDPCAPICWNINNLGIVLVPSKFVFQLGHEVTTDIDWGSWCVVSEPTTVYAGWAGYGAAAESTTCYMECEPNDCVHREIGIFVNQSPTRDIVWEGGVSAAVSPCEDYFWCPGDPEDEEHKKYLWPLLCSVKGSASISWDNPSHGHSSIDSRYASTSAGASLPLCEVSAQAYGFNTFYVAARHSWLLCHCRCNDCGENVEHDPWCGDCGEKMKYSRVSKVRTGFCFESGPALVPHPIGLGWRQVIRLRPQGTTGWGLQSVASGAIQRNATGPGTRTGIFSGSGNAALDDAIDADSTTGTELQGENEVPSSDISDYLNNYDYEGCGPVEMESFESTETYERNGDINRDGKLDWDDRRMYNVLVGMSITDNAYTFAADWDLDGDIDMTDFVAFSTLYPTLAGCPADCGSQGGSPILDVALNNNDWIVYTNEFFNQDLSADCGSQGGVAVPDGLFDNNDWIVYTNWFFSSCS